MYRKSLNKQLDVIMSIDESQFFNVKFSLIILNKDIFGIEYFLRNIVSCEI